MRILFLALLLLISCTSETGNDYHFPWRLEEAIKNAPVVEGLWLGKPERATLGVAGRAVLGRATLNNHQVDVAKEIVLALTPHEDPPGHKDMGELLRPGDECYPDFAFVFRGQRNAIVAAFDACRTCRIEGLGHEWRDFCEHPDERLVQLALQLFPEHTRYAGQQVEKPVLEGKANHN